MSVPKRRTPKKGDAKRTPADLNREVWKGKKKEKRERSLSLSLSTLSLLITLSQKLSAWGMGVH